MPVLFEKEGKLTDQIIGKTPYMQSVYILNLNKNMMGKIVNVRIITASSASLSGEVVEYS